MSHFALSKTSENKLFGRLNAGLFLNQADAKLIASCYSFKISNSTVISVFSTLARKQVSVFPKMSDYSSSLI